MKSNYKPIGDFIRLVDERNTGLKIPTLLGLSISKEFIPSVANIIGSDMESYKIIRKNQFACSLMQVRRDKKMPVALLKEMDEAIISQAYPVFEIKKTETLLPEYLMMWFSRLEFDREACFYAVGGVRGSLEWADFCNMQFPVPPIEKQKEIVEECHTIVNRIKLNEQLNQELEETAQALYKQWFVDFEFPDENGNPYKSSGGEMEWNAAFDKEIPIRWTSGHLNDIADLIDGDRGTNYPNQSEMTSEGHCLFLNAGNVTKDGFAFFENAFISEGKDNQLRKGKLKRHDVVLTTRGTVGNLAYYGPQIEYEHIRINSGMIIMRSKGEPENTLFTFFLMKSSDLKMSTNNYLSGSAQPQFPIKDMVKIPILVPENLVIQLFVDKVKYVQASIDVAKRDIRTTNSLLNIILSKMTQEN